MVFKGAPECGKKRFAILTTAVDRTRRKRRGENRRIQGCGDGKSRRLLAMVRFREGGCPCDQSTQRRKKFAPRKKRQRMKSHKERKGKKGVHRRETNLSMNFFSFFRWRQLMKSILQSSLNPVPQAPKERLLVIYLPLPSVVSGSKKTRQNSKYRDYLVRKPCRNVAGDTGMRFPTRLCDDAGSWLLGVRWF